MLFLENFLCGGNHNCDFSVKLSCGAEEAGWFFVKVFAREGRGSGKIFSAAKRVQTDVAPRGRARAGILYPAAGQRKRGMPYHAVGQARAGMPYLAREKHKSSFFLIRKGRFWKNTQSRPKNGKKQPPQDVLRGIFVPGDIQLYESLLSIRSHILCRISSGLRCPLFSALFAVAHEIQIFTDSLISLYIGVAPHFDFCIKGLESSEQNHVFSIPPLFSKPFGSVVNCCVPAATGPIDFRPSKLLVHRSELLLYSKTLTTPDPLRLHEFYS